MKVHVASDLHLEFHRDGGDSVIAEFTPNDVEVIVLAGDICSASMIPDVASKFCAKYKHVIYVPGNHEYFDVTPGEVFDKIWDASAANDGFHWLNDSAIEIEGRRFLGATMWYPKPAMRKNTHDPFWYHDFIDFTDIKDFEPWVFEQNKMTTTFIREETRPGDIVVTHHLPSHLSVSRRYAGQPTNVFFVCQMDDVIAKNRPAVWIHGHTHDSKDYKSHDTRVICNPFGYVGHALNEDFVFDVDLVL